MSHRTLDRLVHFTIGGRWSRLALCAVLLFAAILLRAPAAFAFPYQATFGSTDVYSEHPIGASLRPVLARADRLLAKSPINEPGVSRQIVLTDGGWRWRIMALDQATAIAFRRPLSDVLVFNRSDVAGDRIASIGGTRTLSGTIAHETTHLLVARRYGLWRSIRLPAWKREGYPDYVAGETSIDPADEARIRARDPDSRLLVYFEGRRRVAAALARNGGSVDALMMQ